MLRIIGFLTLVTLASSLNCGIQGEDGTTNVLLPAVKESQVGGVVLANFPIFNVSSTGAVSSPHARYLRVLRYETRYEVLSADPLPEFVQTERSQTLIRDVIFTCSDGDKIQYSLYLPVLDENTEAPSFDAAEYIANATVTSTGNGSMITIDAGIYVSDADVDKRNADLILRSSNARFVPLVVELANSDAFLYNFNLMVPDDVDVGDYQVILTADDGKHSASALLRLTIIGAEEEK